MEQQSVRKTYKYRLKPPPAQAQVLEGVLWRCRELYNAGLEERKAAWEQCGVSVNFAMQSAQLPAIKEARPEYRDINAQVLQDVLHRLDRAFQAFFRRVKAGEQPGYPRFQGKDRYNSFTYPQVGEHGGAVLEGRILSLSKIGRILVRLHRPLQGTPKTVTISKEADGWYACISCAEVPTEPLPLTGRETGIDVGVKVFLVTADGEYVENPTPPSQCRERAEESPEMRLPPEEGGQAMVESGWAVCPQISEGQATTVRLPAQDGARPGTRVRHDLSGRPPGTQPVAPSPSEVEWERRLSAQWSRAKSRPQQVYSGRGVECLPTNPHLQGSVGRQASGSHPSRVHHAGL